MTNNSLPPSRQTDAPSQPGWPRQVEAWRELLAQCARKPSRKRVHALRSLTLRLRVVLEHRLPKHPANSHAARALRRWRKKGKKLRQALEPVRNADVFLARLDSFRGLLPGTPDSDPQLSPRCLREIGELEDHLRQQRLAGAEKLMHFLDVSGKRLIRLSKEMETAMAPHRLSETYSTAGAALGVFSQLASELPHLDAANLHAYRKRLKQALYLAETSAAADPFAAHLAAAFRKIHLAAGEWHDWQALALEAGRFLKRDGKQEGLVSVLQVMEEKALKRALGLRRRSAARFLKKDAGNPPSPPRKPVASDPVFRSHREVLKTGLTG